MNDLYIERNPTAEEYLAVRKSVTLDMPIHSLKFKTLEKSATVTVSPIAPKIRFLKRLK